MQYGYGGADMNEPLMEIGEVWTLDIHEHLLITGANQVTQTILRKTNWGKDAIVRFSHLVH